MSSSVGPGEAPGGPTASADWPGSDKFVAVQDMLDRNAVLIKQINDNHSIRTPDALQRNVLLIRELNNNVQRIVDLYQELAGVLNSPMQPDAAAAAGVGSGGAAPMTIS